MYRLSNFLQVTVINAPSVSQQYIHEKVYGKSSLLQCQISEPDHRCYHIA